MLLHPRRIRPTTQPIISQLLSAPTPLHLTSPRTNFSSKPCNDSKDTSTPTSNAILSLVVAGKSSQEADLDRLDPVLSRSLVSNTLRALTGRGVSAARFFGWLSLRKGFLPSPYAYNLLVENAGKLSDYPAMSRVLADMSARRLCLTEQAFAFLAASRSSRSSLKDRARAIVKTLDVVGGSCHASGVFSLVKSLSSIGELDAAMSVIEETTRRACYYNVLIAAKCKAGDFQGAREVFDEMSGSGCDPNANTWNYLLGCLLKNGRVAEACELVEAMERSETNDLPNSLTYEILAFHACKTGRMDLATRLLDQLFLERLAPRITMHTSFIKGYFYGGRVEDACKYVNDMSARDRHSANRNYSLLAKLFRKSGRVIEAGRVLYELMEKGLRPDHSAYITVAKDLHKMGRGDLASELKSMFQRLSVQAAGAER